MLHSRFDKCRMMHQIHPKVICIEISGGADGPRVEKADQTPSSEVLPNLLSEV